MSFNLGRAPPKTREQGWRQREEKLKKKRKQNKKQNRVIIKTRWLTAGELLYIRGYLSTITVGLNQPLGFNSKPVKPVKKWLVIPAAPAVAEIISKGTSICSVLKYIAAEMKKPPPFPPTPFSKRFGFPTTFGTPTQLLKESATVAKKNQRTIMAFRGLALRWLARRIRPGNDDDLVTCEVPKHPITLMAWRERRTYSFEPSTIQRDMCERLLMTTYSVPAYQQPRNPYTNLPLTPEQFYSVLHQLRRAGISHWVLEAYASVKCDMKRYKEQFGEPLLQETTRRQFNSLSPETIEIVLDFIEDEHLVHRVKYDDSIYRWALEERPSLPRIQKWIELCKKNVLHTMTIQDITAASRGLCRTPTELEALRTAAESSAADPIVTHPVA